MRKPSDMLAKPVYAAAATPATQVVIPFANIIGGTDASNNAKTNPQGGYFSRLTHISEFPYMTAYHANQLGNTALVNDNIYWDSRPGGLDQTRIPSPDPGGGKVMWWAAAGEWVSYEFEVAAAGTYSIMTRFAAMGPGEPVTVHMTVDDATSGPFILQPDDPKVWIDPRYSAGALIHTMTDCTTPVGWTLTPGRHLLKFHVDGPAGWAAGLDEAPRHIVWVHYFKVAAAGTPVAILPELHGNECPYCLIPPHLMEPLVKSDPTLATPGVRINAGSPAALDDACGNTWMVDQGFRGGDTNERWHLTAANTGEPFIYRSERCGMGSFSWPLTNGRYLVKLHFAETSEAVSGPGQRLFSFTVQGREFRDFDIWAKAGGALRAHVESVPVEVTDGRLHITFSSVIGDAAINGIEILPQ